MAMFSKLKLNQDFKDAIVLLRFPFFIYLMPVFLFAFTNTPYAHWDKTLAVFFILHFLVYPASNGYNSYYDKDEGSIGGVEKPPPPNPYLWNMVLLLDLLAVFLSWWLVNVWFTAMVLVYLLISKGYSFPPTRWKKYPFVSFFLVCFFQGFFTYLMVKIGIRDSTYLTMTDWIYAAGASLLIGGAYPMSQIYQHEEDRKRGDETLSLFLGLKNTFIWTFCFGALALGVIGFGYYLQTRLWALAVLVLINSHPTYYTWLYYRKVQKDPKNANFQNTMTHQNIAAQAGNFSFVFIWLMDL